MRGKKNSETTQPFDREKEPFGTPEQSHTPEPNEDEALLQFLVPETDENAEAPAPQPESLQKHEQKPCPEPAEPVFPEITDQNGESTETLRKPHHKKKTKPKTEQKEFPSKVSSDEPIPEEKTEVAHLSETAHPGPSEQKTDIQVPEPEKSSKLSQNQSEAKTSPSRAKRFFYWLRGLEEDGSKPNAADRPPQSRPRKILRLTTAFLSFLGIVGIAVIIYETPIILKSGGFQLPAPSHATEQNDRRTETEKAYDRTATPEKNFTALLLEDGSAAIAAYTGKETDLVLPRMISGHPVTKIADNAFAYSDVTSVRMYSTVTEIGTNAFFGCDRLTEIELSPKITEIGNNAFYGCISLTRISLPETLTRIGDFTFCKCTALTEIELPEKIQKLGRFAFSETGLKTFTPPESLTSVGEGCFRACEQLEQVVLPETLTEIANDVFLNCTQLQTVTFGSALSRIGRRAFSGCVMLSDLRLPNTLTAIEEEAFRGCRRLYNLTLPESVSEIGTRAFYNCSGLMSVYGGRGVAKVGTRCFDGTLLTDASDVLQLVLGDGNLVKFFGNTPVVEITPGIKTICEGAFENNTAVQTVLFPESVVEIQDAAFRNCTELSTILLPNSLQKIGKEAFANCFSLVSAELPNQLSEMGEGAFSMCSMLKGITLPASLAVIPDHAFSKCTALNEVHFRNQQSIGACAFEYCRSLAAANIPGTVKTIGMHAFSGCTALNNLTLKNGIEQIGDYAFAETAVRKISLPSESLTYAGENMFFNCPKLTTVYGIKGTYAYDWAERHGL